MLAVIVARTAPHPVLLGGSGLAGHPPSCTEIAGAAAALPCLGKCMGRPCPDCRAAVDHDGRSVPAPSRRHCGRTGPGRPFLVQEVIARLRATGEIEADDLVYLDRIADRGSGSPKPMPARDLNARASNAR